MSSGTLPLNTYHRASQIGEGTFGSVITVYNDDGEEYALKLFLEDEDDEEDNYEEDDSRPIDLGTLREISCLRLLRSENSHPNIVPMVDVQGEWVEDEDCCGAGTTGCLSVALPLYKRGSLADAVGKGILKPLPRRVKVEIAHGILKAVCYLHENGIIHRDIKSDNILLEESDNSNGLKAVLIDFSLAKILPESNMITTELSEKKRSASSCGEQVRHTSEVGTVGYTPPEVIDGQPYGKPMDLWSVGVVLLEMLQNKCLVSTKPNQALSETEHALSQLAKDQPFPDLIRSLLKTDPAQRVSARQALQHPVFAKFGLSEPKLRSISLAEALPYAENEEEEENISPKKNLPQKDKKVKRDPILEKRMRRIEKLCKELDSKNPITATTALEYCQQLYELDDELDNPDSSQGLLDCVILAFRFWELEVLDLKSLDDATTGSFAKWTLENYVDNEGCLFMMLDYCLYPRTVNLLK